VRVDRRKVGKVRSGETFSVDVAPGQHVVRLAVDWCRSPKVRFYSFPGETVRLTCSPTALILG
jgi:hypothetical protein